MALLDNVVGLDLGSHSLKAVELSQSLRSFQVVQQRQLERLADEASLAELVSRFAKQYRFHTDHVIAALPGDKLSSRRLSLPFRDRKKLAQAVPHTVADDLPFELEDVIIDWQLANEDRAKAEVLATVAARSEVAALLELLRSADCEPRTLEAEGPVLANLTQVFDLAGVRMLVDLGHRKTTFCVVAEGHPVAFRTVPIAGAAITRALSEDRQLSAEQAERAKHERGVFGPSFAMPGPRTQQVFDSLMREALRTLGSLEAALAGSPVQGITLFGGSAHLAGIDAFFSDRCGLPATRLGLPKPGEASGLAAGGDPLLYAPAIALALRGTARARTQMNFRQDEFAVRLDLRRYGRELKRAGLAAGVAAVLGLAAFGVGSFGASHRASRAEAEIARLYSEANPGQAVPANAVGAMRQQMTQERELAAFLGVYEGNRSALDVLTEISNQIPASLDIALDELSIDRQTVRMRVFAKTYEASDQIKAELSQLSGFSATVGAVENDEKRGGKRFNVTISIAAPEDAK
jgi:type IV pilus assembly protein PilM